MWTTCLSSCCGLFASVSVCHFVLVLLGTVGEHAAGVQASSKREADYTLDDSFWIDESPAGEVERLLREYTQNQEMVRNIGSHYYQIIYPVQLRQHKKMGISTREIGSSKRGQGSDSSSSNTGGGSSSSYQGSPGRGSGRQRTGKHFHRTSLLIKAFNHKFRLDLELNTQLIAPNIMQKHFLANGAEQVSKQEIEHCYYHGTVQDYPGASAAFHTCNGVSGVIHIGNETFVIHPFYGGDLSKHPHVIFEARTKANKGCANTGNMEWRLNPHTGFLPSPSGLHATARERRDVRDATKYIEIALIIDKAMFEKRNGSTRAEVVHDSIQVANIVDLYFRTLYTRVSVVYVETWQGGNQALIDRQQDIGKALSNFNDYTSRKLFKVDKDTTQLLTGEIFAGGEAGMAVPATVCTAKAVGINVDINTYEPHLLAGTMAHMIGHNIGMGHDDGREECFCRDWHGCIMAQAIVGLDNVQPYKFSQCSQSDYIDRLRTGNGICLFNKPNELEVRRTCGNRIVEEGEDCDCGSIDDCPNVDPCCDPITCKLTKEADCALGPCCQNCQLRDTDVVCRKSRNECDLPEYCTGLSGDCPPDAFKKNGKRCGTSYDGGGGGGGGGVGHCFKGQCPTLLLQCQSVWGPGGIAADHQCIEQFNPMGSINGHCGNDAPDRFVKCAPKNVRCGSLQCQRGSRYPVSVVQDQSYSRTIIASSGIELECKSLHRTTELTIRSTQAQGLVLDGTPCGENLICVNQTCTSVFPHQDKTKCPTNNNDLECSGHGDCTNNNKCFCESSWSGPDCSIELEMTPTPPLPTAPTDQRSIDLSEHMTKKETPYESYHGSNTVFLVGTLMSVVGGVFVVFATMALCYRKTTVRKYEPAYKKPRQKNSFVMTANHSNSQEESLNNADKIMTYSASAPAYGDHKMQQLKRIGVGSSGDDDQQHSGEEETVSFIDLQHNNLKPEKKGILKKHDYGLLGTCDGKDGSSWGGTEPHPDDVLLQAQSDATMAQIMGSASMTEVERTLKSLNGYHEDILKALRNAASHRGSSTPSGSTSALSEEVLRRSLQECAAAGYPRDLRDIRSSSRENIMEPQVVVVEAVDDDDEEPPGPIRIRNLEDLIRQLEHHSQASRHMSPSGSEDIRMSETEADRHYRQESSSACSESSHQSHRDSRFVYGRYRQPSSRLPYPHSHMQAEEESIYESADRDRVGTCGDTPDSESDDFIQAQQQLARWASEEIVAVAQAQQQHQVVLCGVAGVTGGGIAGSGVVNCAGGLAGGGGIGIGAGHAGSMMLRDYFPSPSSSTSEEPTSVVRAPAPVPMPMTMVPVPMTMVPVPGSSGLQQQQQQQVPAPPPPQHHPEHATIHRPKRYPEYKH